MMVSIVIANNGRDISLLRSLWAGREDAEIIEIDAGLERSRQRNIGIKAAKGKYILILDSDQIIIPRLVEQLSETMDNNPDCVGLYIPEIITGKGFWAKVRNFERQLYTGTDIDCVRFVRNPCPMFDETMSGPEDTDWNARIPGKKLVSQGFLLHQENLTLKEYLGKKKYYAKSFAAFAKANPSHNFLKPAYRIKILLKEWKTLLMHPILTCALVALLTMKGIILWRR